MCRMTKPAGTLGAGGLVRLVLTLTWWLVPETVICSLTLAVRGVARVVRGSWFGYPIARRVLCRSHVQSLIRAWAAVVGHERVYFVVETRGTSFSCTTSATQNTPK